jgi:hypothetical protein
MSFPYGTTERNSQQDATLTMKWGTFRPMTSFVAPFDTVTKYDMVPRMRRITPSLREPAEGSDAPSPGARGVL